MDMGIFRNHHLHLVLDVESRLDEKKSPENARAGTGCYILVFRLAQHRRNSQLSPFTPLSSHPLPDPLQPTPTNSEALANYISNTLVSFQLRCNIPTMREIVSDLFLRVFN